MPKAAILISGMLREHVSCFPSIQRHLIDPLKSQFDIDCDIFVHTWNRNDYPPMEITEDDLMIYGDRLRCYSIEAEKDFNDLFRNTETEIAIRSFSYNLNMYKMFYKIEKCNEMMIDYCNKSGESYDYVIKLRSDIMFDGDFDLSFMKDMPDDMIYYPTSGMWTFSHIRVNDQMWICNFNTSKKMNDIFDSACNLLKTTPHQHPETTLYRYVVIKKINGKNFDCKYHFFRAQQYKKVDWTVDNE